MSNPDRGTSSKYNFNELDQVIRKIILYSRNDVSPSKFLKYLNILSKCSTNVPGVESQLRRRGALEAIVLALKHLKLQECEEERDKKYSPVVIEGKDREVIRKIYNEGLRVLSNAFVVDYKSRREAIRANFVPFLQKVILNNPNDNVNLARSIKCLVNLSKDQECLLLVRKNYIYQSILSLLSKILGNFKEKNEFSDGDLPLLSALIRAIRIFSSDEILRTILLRENAMMLLGEIFVLQEYDSGMKSEFLRSFEAITDKVRSFPKEMIFQLSGTESGKKILKSIIDNIGLFERIPIDCLLNLSNSGSISRALGFCGIFPILLEHIEKLMGKNEFVALGRHLTLVSKLSKSAKENQLHLSLCSQKILLDILKSPNCREFQLTVLSLFEDYYESAFNSLLSFGFVDILFRILVEEGGKCSYEEISKRLQNFDDQKDEDKCPAHEKCIFKPTYRCNSPTYHEVKRSMEEYLRRREEEGNNKRKSENSSIRMSPDSKRTCYFPSSPSSSISSFSARCSSADVTDEEEGTISPFEGDEEPFPIPLITWNIMDESDPPLHFSEEEELSVSSGFQEMSPDMPKEENDNDNEPTSTTVKRTRESTEEFKDFSPPPLSPERESQTNYSSSYSSSSSFTTTLKGTKVPESFEKISSILKTFSKAIHFTSFPLKSLIELTPYLLSILINGKLNQEAESFYSAEGNPEPVKQIGMKIFSYSWSILKFLSLKIDIQDYLLKTKIINLLFKIFYPYEEKDEFYKKYGECLLENLWGVSDISNYYREAQFDSILRLSPNYKTEIALTIPLFFFRRLKVCRLINKSLSSNSKFESFYSLSKNEIFLILSRDELEFERFQECILALIAIAGIFSASWTEADEFKKRRLLFKPSEIESENDDGDGEKVKFVLDDGSEVFGNKSIITSQCPVFSAMFEGHFTESREQKVTFRDTSKKTLTQFLHQISQLKISRLKDEAEEEVEEIVGDSLLDLDTIFGLISLSNMFMLEELFVRGMNSLVAFYLCPHSAASIFERAVQFEAFEKPGWWKSELNLIAIKYLLVGPGISLTARISAFWQIFDLVENNELVAKHLIKTIDFFHEFKSKSSLTKY